MKSEVEADRQKANEDMNLYIRGYFQEWLDINALSQFKNAVQKNTSLKQDWLNLTSIAYQMKFYSCNSVSLMSNVIQKKWINTSERSRNVLVSQFLKFKHTSPFILQLFDFVNNTMVKNVNPV